MQLLFSGVDQPVSPKAGWPSLTLGVNVVDMRKIPMQEKKVTRRNYSEVRPKQPRPARWRGSRSITPERRVKPPGVVAGQGDQLACGRPGGFAAVESWCGTISLTANAAMLSGRDLCGRLAREDPSSLIVRNACYENN